VVRAEDGRFPGGMPDLQAAEEYVQAVTVRARGIWQPALVRLRVSGTTVVVSDKFFDLDRECLALLLSRVLDVEKGAANGVLNNSIRGFNDGVAVPRCISKRLVVEHLGSSDSGGKILAHELGHFLGLLHQNSQAANLMNHVVSGTDLTDDQVEAVHHHMS